MEYAILAALVGGVWALLLWLSIIVWVYRDIRDRTSGSWPPGPRCLRRDDVLPRLNIPGLALYLMLAARDA